MLYYSYSFIYEVNPATLICVNLLCEPRHEAVPTDSHLDKTF